MLAQNLQVVVARHKISSSSSLVTVSYAGAAITAKTLCLQFGTPTLSADRSFAQLNLTSTAATMIQFQGALHFRWLN